MFKAKLMTMYYEVYSTCRTKIYGTKGRTDLSVLYMKWYSIC